MKKMSYNKFISVVITCFWCLILLNNINVAGQSWFHLYGGGQLHSVIKKSLEDYDKGYIFSGYQWDPTSGFSYGWLLKTDINGNQRWAKSYGFPMQWVQFNSLTLSPVQGIIMAGFTNKLNNQCTDPIIVAVNACGEKEWCRIYASEDCDSFCEDILPLSGGGYIALINYWKTLPVSSCWLLKLDNLGAIVWQQAYATDPAFRDEVAHSLMMTTDSTVVITGDTYYADSLFPGFQVLKIFHVKTDLDGNVIFEKPWGENMGVISDARTSIEGNTHALYTAGRRAREGGSGDSPCLFKTGPLGQSLYYHDILNTTIAGIANSISSFNDKTLALSAQWKYSIGPDSTSIFRTDTLGNILNKKFSNYSPPTNIGH